MVRSGTLGLLIGVALYAEPPLPECESPLCTLVASGRLSSLRWPDFSDCALQVEDFYKSSGYALVWSRDGEPTRQARSIIELLQEAEEKGLDPADYEGPRWADRIDELISGKEPLSEQLLSQFDVALTVSLMRYISDLNRGKLNPDLAHTPFDLDSYGARLASFISDRLVNGESAASTIEEEVEPPYDGYRWTVEALHRYLALSRSLADSEVPLPVPKDRVAPGSSYGAIQQLADKLRLLGDLPKDAIVERDSPVYGPPLVDAVKHFQERHGLAPDGVLGKSTLTQLNVPLSHRVLQLRLTLDRWRWVPHNFPRPPLIVNVPEFELRGLDSEYHTELEMKVVVGGAFAGHQTPAFAAEMTYVTFRPYWNVPVSIQKLELVPKIEKDQSYLVKNRYEVVTLADKVVTEGTVDDKILEKLRSAELHIRQIPGPENALGLVAFTFPNKYDVFLHGTPATELFSKTRRDFSHGCIRVEKPAELAEWVLRGLPEWTPERIAFAMNNETGAPGKPRKVMLDQPIPVLIVYATAVVLTTGEVRFFDDIYRHDARSEELLSQGYPYTSKRSTSAAPARRRRE